MHVVDLYPTLIRQAGASSEQELPLDGMDMWEAITARRKSPRTEVVHSLPGENGDTGLMAIRQGDFKLVGPELFNLKVDPAETTDVAQIHPEIYRSLHERLLELTEERRECEVHTPITQTIDQPLLVFGEDENANPPAWLAPYIQALPPGKQRTKTPSKGRRKGAVPGAATDAPKKPPLTSGVLFERRDRDNDGRVTWEEYRARRTGPTVPNLRARFDKRDEDGDGVWERSEIETD